MRLQHYAKSDDREAKKRADLAVRAVATPVCGGLRRHKPSRAPIVAAGVATALPHIVGAVSTCRISAILIRRHNNHGAY